MADEKSVVCLMHRNNRVEIPLEVPVILGVPNLGLVRWPTRHPACRSNIDRSSGKSKFCKFALVFFPHRHL